jgi:hypothetical protein
MLKRESRKNEIGWLLSSSTSPCRQHIVKSEDYGWKDCEVMKGDPKDETVNIFSLEIVPQLYAFLSWDIDPPRQSLKHQPLWISP